MKKMQSGFTLIELIMVIVILGALAAVALPRYADLATDARIASVNGLSGAVRAASAIVHAQALIDGQTGATGSVSIEGQTINTVYGYPATTDIDNALSDYSGFTFTAGTFSLADSGGNAITNCGVTYAAPTAANAAPAITVTTSGC